MKALLVALILVGLLGAGLYFTGTFSMPSPQEQADKIRELVKTKGSWEALVDLQPPAKYRDVVSGNMSGRGAEQKFDRAVFAERVKSKSGREGYALEYIMSADIAFEVMVGPDGKLDSISELATMKSLMTPGG